MTQIEPVKARCLRSKNGDNSRKADGTVVQVRLKEETFQAIDQLQALIEKNSGIKVSRSVIIRRALLGYLLKASKTTPEQLDEEVELLRIYCR